MAAKNNSKKASLVDAVKKAMHVDYGVTRNGKTKWGEIPTSVAKYTDEKGNVVTPVKFLIRPRSDPKGALAMVGIALSPLKTVTVSTENQVDTLKHLGVPTEITDKITAMIAVCDEVNGERPSTVKASSTKDIVEI